MSRSDDKRISTLKTHPCCAQFKIYLQHAMKIANSAYEEQDAIHRGCKMNQLIGYLQGGLEGLEWHKD